MTRNLRNQTLALAALFQALGLIRSIAHKGTYEAQALPPCLATLLKPYNGNLEDQLGGLDMMRQGLSSLHAHLRHPSDVELTRYAITLTHLESKLRKRRRLLEEMVDGVGHARRQAVYFDNPCHGSVLSKLASVYAETVSTVKPRILVHGQRNFLEDTRNADLIRALLLSGLRSVTFWREAGGGRIKLLIHRQRLIHACETLLDEARRHPSPPLA